MIQELDKFGFPVIDFHPVIITNGERYISDKTLKALIDTGAYNCFIDKKLINEMGIQPTGKKHIFKKLMEKENQEVDTYNIYINIPGFNKTFNIVASERVGEYPYPLILGTHFLSMFEFNYNGKQKIFEINLMEG